MKSRLETTTVNPIANLKSINNIYINKRFLFQLCILALYLGVYIYILTCLIYTICNLWGCL